MAAGGRALHALQARYPFVQAPFLVSAPMRVFAGAALAVATSRAGGLGFIGPGAKPTDLESKLAAAQEMLRQRPLAAGGDAESSLLPIGVGFQLFDGDLAIAQAALRKHPPVAAWLFVPANDQRDVDRWTAGVRAASPQTDVWLQVGSVAEAVAAARSPDAPDVLVLQGADAGGHGLRRGAGVTVLLLEVADALAALGCDNIPLFGAGGVADGRGVAAVLATGVAAGAVMGSRFLASTEAEISAGFQQDILRTHDGGQSTRRTDLFDTLQERHDWPRHYDGRAIVNATVREHEAGVDPKTIHERFQRAQKTGEDAWGVNGRLTSYVGAAVGLISRVQSSREILETTRRDARAALQRAAEAIDAW